MIYLDSAATSFYRPPVWQKRWQRPFPVWETAPEELIKKHLQEPESFLRPGLLSEMFHGDGPEQVAFTANSTESLNIAIKG